ncbi:MAG: hypothetical protein VKP62_13225 [Candidatus Sericytochromatia bacterium]|nr:hypothetical protein [Candidatus Sericytochromatia bacterium]
MTFFSLDASTLSGTVNFAALRIQVLERLHQEPHACFSRRERVAIMDGFVEMAKQHLQHAAIRRDAPLTRDWRDNAGLVILSRDMEELPFDVPKWVLLFGWLAPESAAAWCPDLLAEVTLRALNGTLGQAPPRRSPRPRKR